MEKPALYEAGTADVNTFPQNRAKSAGCRPSCIVVYNLWSIERTVMEVCKFCCRYGIGLANWFL